MHRREEKKKSGARSTLEAEWERLKTLIPHPVKSNATADAFETDILKLIDGKRSCEEIVSSQDLSIDSAVLIFLKMERDCAIHCVAPSEKLRDVKFEKSEVEKDLEFIKIEKSRLQERLVKVKGELLHIRAGNKSTKKSISSLQDKIAVINENVERLNEKHKVTTASVDCMVSSRMDIFRRKGEIDKSLGILSEEVVFLKDEKWSAMKSIKELESKIEEVFHAKELLSPKMSVCRSVMREAYKSLRAARDRADNAVKNSE